MKNLKPKHFVLMGTAILQIVLFIIFLTSLFNGSTVCSYLDKGKYEKAVTLINKYDKLAENDDIEKRITAIANSTKAEFLSGSLTYGKAESVIQVLSALKSSSFKDVINKAESCISSVNNGDVAVSEKKYDNALEYYGNVTDEELKDKKIRMVYDSMSSELSKMAEVSKYDEIMRAVDQFKAQTKDNDMLAHISEWEKKYLAEWIDKQRADHKYIGENGALELAVRYDALSGGSDTLSSVDGEFQSYLMNEVGNQNYGYVLEILDSSFGDIEQILGAEGAKTYNDFRITCAASMLNQAHENNEYTGATGALALADRLNSYQDGAVDKVALINELSAKERYALIDKINASRKSVGLSELISDPGLENSAYAMMSKIDNGSYDDKVLFDVMNANGVKCDKACCAWNDDAQTADEVFSKFTPIENYTILTEPDLKKIGVGMSFDEGSQKFSWFIIEIK